MKPNDVARACRHAQSLNTTMPNRRQKQSKGGQSLRHATVKAKAAQPTTRSKSATQRSKPATTNDTATAVESVVSKPQLFAFGYAFFYQTGVPGACGSQLWEPCQVSVPGTQEIICCGANFTLSLDDEGKVFQWGTDVEVVIRSPRQVVGFRGKVVQIACGKKHSLALTENNSVYSWGAGSHGQLGHGTAETVCINEPKQINCLRDRHRDPPKAIYAGGNTSGIITRNKALLLWGSNLFGQVSQTRSHSRWSCTLCI